MEKLYNFIESVKNEPKFKELDEFLGLTTIRGSVEESLRYYLRTYKDDADELIGFIRDYISEKPAEICKTEKGYINLCETRCLRQPNFLAKSKGDYFDGWIVLTDGTRIMRKQPISYKVNLRTKSSDAVYCSIVATTLAKQLGVSTAEYFLGEKEYSQTSILTPSFLKANEQLNSLSEKRTYISDVLRDFETVLDREDCSEEETENFKFEFIKQRFFAKLIGLRDEKIDNMQYITSTDEKGKKHIRIAPMFDYDYSFHVGEEVTNYIQLSCDNGKNDIESFMQQYKDFPGFKDFSSSCMQKYNMYEAFRNTGLSDFSISNDGKRRMQENFKDYIDSRMKEVRQAYKQIYGLEEKENNIEEK